MKTKNNAALVTGGALRIGRAICRALARQGRPVVVHCFRSRPEAEELAASIRSEGGQAWIVQGDLRPPGSCRRIVTEAWEQAGGLTLLVNNAAVFRKDALLTTTAEDNLEQVRLNFLAAAQLMREFAARVLEEPVAPPCGRRGVGRIINLLDSRISRIEAGELSYQVSKHMLAALTLSAARELAPCITVNAVAPGPVLPPEFGQQADKRGREPAGPIPLGQRPTPEDVADAVAFLARATGITGEILFVDGGQHLLRMSDIGA